MANQLFVYEWLIVVLFCTLLCILSLLAYMQPKKPPILIVEQPLTTLEVHIKGAVENPGTYYLPIKSTLKDLLSQAQLTAVAEKKNIRWQRKLLDGQTIVIPSKKCFRIVVEGAIEEPGSYEVVAGTRYCDLLSLLKFLPQADLKSLRKNKQLLSDKTKVVVPFKQIR